MRDNGKICGCILWEIVSLRGFSTSSRNETDGRTVVQQKLTRLSIAVCDTVEMDLDKLLTEGIVETI